MTSRAAKEFRAEYGPNTNKNKRTVEANNIEDAVKPCRDAHQPWPVASTTTLFSLPAICVLSRFAAVQYNENRSSPVVLFSDDMAERRCEIR
jgi:hypothetical protein